MLFDNYIGWIKAYWYISATGNPAPSVPAGFTSEGLPVGVLQIVSRAKQDFGVLQLRPQLNEQAASVSDIRPSRKGTMACLLKEPHLRQLGFSTN